jgi:hypothetical protein
MRRKHHVTREKIKRYQKGTTLTRAAYMIDMERRGTKKMKEEVSRMLIMMKVAVVRMTAGSGEPLWGRWHVWGP